MELSPIIEVAVSENTEAAQRLLADGQLQPAELNGALFTAVEHTPPEVVRLLLAHGTDVNAWDEFGQTPLHLCCLRQAGVNSPTPVEADAEHEALRFMMCSVREGHQSRRIPSQFHRPRHLHSDALPHSADVAGA